MNTNSLKKTYFGIRSWVFAISVTIAVHFILFTIFVPIKLDLPEVNTAQHSQIMMLPLNLKDSNSRINELITWMDNENSGSITGPNNKFGYTSIIKQDPHLPILQKKFDYKPELLAQTIFLPSMKVPEIPIRYDTLKDFFYSLTLCSFTFFPMKLSVTNQEKITTYPYVENLYQEYNLPVNFFNLGEKNSLIKKYTPSSPTILKMYYADDKSLLPSGVVIESCGVKELDRIGLDTITAQNFPDYIKTKLAGKNICLKIDWQAPYTKLSK